MHGNTNIKYATKSQNWRFVTWLLETSVDRSGLDMITKGTRSTLHWTNHQLKYNTVTCYFVSFYTVSVWTFISQFIEASSLLSCMLLYLERNCQWSGYWLKTVRTPTLDIAMAKHCCFTLFLKVRWCCPSAGGGYRCITGHKWCTR